MSHSPRFLSSLALLISAGSLPVFAQQRVEVTTRRSPARAESDSVEREIRGLRRQLDSLSAQYNQTETTTAVDRRRISEVMRAVVERLADIGNRQADGYEFHYRTAPAVGADRGTTSAARAFVTATSADATPRGWIGFVAEGPGIEPRVEAGELIVRYMAYPRVTSVDPSSPAQRAGIIPNDTLLAYDGRDVRENDISLTRLLTPNARVSVRVKRDGKVHDLPVIVAAAPQRIVIRRGDEVRAPREAWVVSGVPDAPSFPAMPPSPSSAAAGAVRAMRVASSASSMAPAIAPIPAYFGFVQGGVAGMQLSTITTGLARAIGVSSGVLVTAVPVGSPAAESGFEEGDVIIKVSGQPTRTLSDVRGLVGAASQNGVRSVEAEVLRDKKPQKLLLRW